jgi:hypothetical protein
MKTLLVVIGLGIASVGCRQATNDYPKSALKFAGFSTPDAALETWTWALINGDKAELMQSLTPEARKEWEQVLTRGTDEEWKSLAAKRAAHLTEYTIQKREVISADEVVIHILVNGTDPMKKDIKKIGNEWKIAGSK